MSKNLPLYAATFLAVLAVGACGSKPEPVTPAPQEPRTVARPATDDAADRARREAEERARREAEEAARARATLEQRVHFDYDDARIRSDAQAVLVAKVPLLKADPGLKLRVEGHADDRGSTEYNMALGMRRARSIVEFLTGYGIEASRLETVSFGEERPLVTGPGERSWAQNRRGDFVPSGGRVAGTP